MGDATGQIPPQKNIHRLLPSGHAEVCSAARNQESWLICVPGAGQGQTHSVRAEAGNVHLARSHTEFCESHNLLLPQSILKAQDSSPLPGLSGKVAEEESLAAIGNLALHIK